MQRLMCEFFPKKLKFSLYQIWQPAKPGYHIYLRKGGGSPAFASNCRIYFQLIVKSCSYLIPAAAASRPSCTICFWDSIAWETV